MGPILRAQWISLCRDRTALLLTFALPVVFFTLFAFLFGGAGRSSGDSETPKIRLTVFDIDRTDASRRIAESLAGIDGVRIFTLDELLPNDVGNDDVSEEELARRVVTTNKVDAAVLLPKGLSESVGDFGNPDRPAILIIYDSANPYAQPMLSGVLQASVFTAVPDLLMNSAMDQFTQFGGPLTKRQQGAIATWMPMLSGAGNSSETAGAEDSEAKRTGGGVSMADAFLKIESSPAREAKNSRGGPPGSMVAYYAAGTSVMFLLFSMAGAAGSLLAYEEDGTIERLLAGSLTPGKLILSHWMFFILIGLTQLTIMFVFGQFVFGIGITDLTAIAGTAVMTLCTVMAAAAFGLLLATICRTRKQLEGLSTILILIMSALGGSMAPKFIMPAFVQKTSLVTFNGWALDGFLKVFWYRDASMSFGQSMAELGPQIGMLLIMTGLFMTIAMWRSKRWAVQ